MNWKRRFIRDNMLLLLAKDDRIQSIRMKKKDFFHKHSLKSSESFSLKELALDLVKQLIKLSKITSEEELKNTINTSPFLRARID